MAQFKQIDIAKVLGIPVTLYKDLYKKRILSSKQLAVIQFCVRVGDNGEASFFVPPAKLTSVKTIREAAKTVIFIAQEVI